MPDSPAPVIDAKHGLLNLGMSLTADGVEEHPRMAMVNAILDVAPAPLREKLLIEFLSLLQRPTE